MKPLSVVRGSSWQQEHYETASHEAGQRARELRKRGYRVFTSALGLQVTRLGLMRLTMVEILDPDDALEIPQCVYDEMPL